MNKFATTLGLCTVGIGSLAGFKIALAHEGQSDDAIPQEVRAEAFAVPTDAPREEGGGARAHEVADVARIDARGMTCTPVSPELATQLKLQSGRGLLVTAVAPESVAAAAGLAQFDVVLDVGREPASLAALEVALQGGIEVEMTISRGGALELVALAGDAPESAFLSTASLTADHPFRRVDQVRQLRESLEQRSEQLEQRDDELEAELRQARQDAKAAVETLHQETTAQARAYFDARKAELLALADEGLAVARVEPLRALRVDLADVLPAERLAAIDAALAELREPLQGGLAERARLTDDTSQRDYAQRLQRAGQRGARLLDERVSGPWQEARQSALGHAKRLGSGHDGRMQWTAETVERIRSEVRERIDCAIDRAHEDFSRKLRERLRALDVPAPGEIEASLADVTAQMEAWTRRFLVQTQAALEAYEDEVGLRTRVTVPALAAHLVASEQAAEEFAAALPRATLEALSGELILDDTWRAKASQNDLVDAVGRALTRAVNAGRDGLGAGGRGLVRTLRDEEVVSEDAWRDLRGTLDALRQRAASDCWKLDGPHLDGRFPTEPKRKGDVSVATR